MRKIYFLLLFLMLLPYVAMAQDSQEGYAIDYAAETITIAEGYEVYTEATGGTQIQSGTSITAYIGESLYLQKTGSETTGRTKISIPARPQAPTISATIDYAQEKITAPPGTDTSNWEYSTNSTAWNDVPSGMALSEMGWDGNTPKTYYFRTGATEISFASSEALTTITAPARPAKPAEPTTVEVTSNSITIEVVSGQEYRLGSSGDWSTLTGTTGSDGKTVYTYDKLNPGTEYTIETRTPAETTIQNKFASHPASITVTTKYETELGGLTVSGQSGFEGHFQYGDVITVTFTPQPRVTTSTKSLAENTATQTYTPAEGEAVTLATATVGDDGSFMLTYDTKEKKLPIGEDLTLTVSYGGSSALNPVEETVTLTLDKAILMNVPSVIGNFVYGETLTVNYTKQDDETVTYQWYRSGEIISSATEASYTPTAEDIGKNILVEIIATDEWHRGKMRSTERMVTKAPLDEDAIEITTSESTIELGSEGTILTATITGIEDVNKAENWIWESSNTDIVEVNRLTPEASTTRSADNPIESTARVIPVGVGTATITVIYDSPTYHGEKTYEITVKEKEEEEPEEPVTPDYPDYYNIYVDECEGVTVETSTNVVREGNSMSFTVEVAEGYTAEDMVVKVKRSLFGYTDIIEPNEEGKYEIRNIWTEIYITVEGVEKETPTGIEEITGVKVYTKDGSLYVQTPKQEEVRIISISGAVIKNETQIGLQWYDLPRGIYIICIGEERVKVRN